MLDHKNARRGLSLVFLMLLLDVIGIAIVMPVMPTFLAELMGVSINDAAVYGGWLLFVYAGMQFIFAPLIGNLSDRFGRRPILLASVFTFAVNNLICALATSYWMLFAGRLLAGISGASIATCSAYIADISHPGNRAKNFGLIGIAFGAGFVLGPVIGGLLGEFGPRVPFYGAAVIAFGNFAVAFFLLPETLDHANRRIFQLSRANPFGALKQMHNYPGIGWVLLVLSLFWLAHTVYPAAWAFVGAYRYGWSEGEIGLSLGVYGVCSALATLCLLPWMIRMAGEWKTAAVGLIFAGLGLAGYALAYESWMVYLVVVLTVPEAIADPPLRSIAAGKVSASQQGELQGAMTSLGSLMTIVGPLIFTQLFHVFSGPQAWVEFSGAPYAAGALCILAAVWLFFARIERNRTENAA